MFELKVEKTKAIITASFDSKEWNDETEKVYESTKSKYNVIGFRTGHAPRKVIEKSFGDNVFFNDTFDNFVRRVLNEVLDKNPKLEPVSYPRTTIDSYTVDGGIKFTVEFDIMPEFKLGKYTGLEFKKQSTKATEEEINHEISHLLEDNAKFNDVDRESKMGDEVVIDFVGSIDGVEFEGGRAKDYPLTLGSHSFIDTFEDQLVGKKKGDNVDVNVKFPDDYPAKEYAGKKALFKVTVNAVREKVLPTLDDKFVADATEFETVDEYKKSVIENIQSMKAQNAENALDNDILNHIMDSTEMEIPQTLVDAEVDRNVHNLEDACKMYKMELEDYLKSMGTTLENYKKSLEDRATKNVKSRYILRQLLEENNIVATEKEIDDKVKELFPNAKKQITENDRNYAENAVLLDKVYKFLRENNKIVEE